MISACLSTIAWLCKDEGMSPRRTRSYWLWNTARVLFLLVVGSACCRAQLLTPAWIELGPNGAVIARVVVNTPAECPNITIDGKKYRMALREQVPAGFRPACEFPISAT